MDAMDMIEAVYDGKGVSEVIGDAKGDADTEEGAEARSVYMYATICLEMSSVLIRGGSAGAFFNGRQVKRLRTIQDRSTRVRSLVYQHLSPEKWKAEYKDSERIAKAYANKVRSGKVLEAMDRWIKNLKAAAGYPWSAMGKQSTMASAFFKSVSKAAEELRQAYALKQG